MPDSLVSREWELLDPTPDPLALFLQYNRQFFWGKLESVVVSWSPRMTTCAGICCYEGRGGMCSIKLSTPLLKLRPRKDFVETLLHEMIHAYLFVTQNNRDRDGHGPEFQKHMHRINAEAKTNITIYHNFYAEVKHYKTHVWKCDGPCQHRRPYCGLVKRASNRAPGPNDLWWKDHQASCGGKYHKISEPEEFTKKQEAKKEKDEAKRKKDEIKRRSQITNYLPALSSPNATDSKIGKKPQMFTGTHVLGGSSLISTSPSNKGSKQPMVRKLPGFGEVPLRIPAATTTISNGSGVSYPTDSPTFCPQRNINSNKTSSNRPTHSQPGQRSIATDFTLSDGATSASTSKEFTKTPTPTTVTRSNEVIDLCSDSDDDLMLYTSRPSQSTKPSNTAKRKHPPDNTPPSRVDLSSEPTDSDEELDLLIANLKEKKRRSSCINPLPATTVTSAQHVDHSATSSNTSQPCPSSNSQSSSTAVSTTLKAGMCRCPLCGKQVLIDFINEHMDLECTS